MSLIKTLESLETFVDAQLEIVQRANEEIERLQKLKAKASGNPLSVLQNLDEELRQLSLTEFETEPSGPSYVDWNLLKHADPSVFDSVVIPPLYHHKIEFSATDDPESLYETLQPIISRFRTDADSIPRIEDDPPPQGQEHVISSLQSSSSKPSKAKRKRAVTYDEDDEEDFLDSELSRSHVLKESKAERLAEAASAKVEAPAEDGLVLTSEASEELKTLKKRSRVIERPANHKAPWTIQEQHWLERCLLQVPATERLRCQKISELMGGTRTARQIQSRLQRYNLKLKEYGLA